MKYVISLILIGACFCAQASAIHSIEMETYGPQKIAVTIILDNNSKVTTKLIDALSLSPKMKPVPFLQKHLAGDLFGINFNESFQTIFDLGVDTTTAPHVKVGSGVTGQFLTLNGATAASLHAALWESSSKSVLSVKNQNGKVVMLNQDVAILEGDTFGANQITCSLDSKTKAAECNVELHY